jgi:23S rRNA (pseudouridine1915-N3)-methyltransferase
MRIVVAAIGRLKDGAERDLAERYRGLAEGLGRRLRIGPVDVTELTESRRGTIDERRQDEAHRLLDAAGAGLIIALHERGRTFDSAGFAAFVRTAREEAHPRMVLLIGGPDGHGAEALAAARLQLSLGAMTLPHGLARIVLLEQIYRALTILAGHPYHRA